MKLEKQNRQKVNFLQIVNFTSKHLRYSAYHGIQYGGLKNEIILKMLKSIDVSSTHSNESLLQGLGFSCLWGTSVGFAQSIYHYKYFLLGPWVISRASPVIEFAA